MALIQRIPPVCAKCFYLQNTGHYRVTGKMSLEKKFIERYIFYTHNIVIGKLNYLINQQKRIPVRQCFFYLLLGINSRLIGIINRDTLCVLIFFDVLFDLFCKLYIAAMAGPVCNDMRFDGITDQCKVTDHIQ